MGAIGGDIKEITFSHPTLGSGSFFPQSGQNNTIKLGGIQSVDDENLIDGSGEIVETKVRTRGFIEAVVSNDMNTRQDLIKAQQLQGSNVQADYTIAFQNDTVWSCKGAIVGSLEGDTHTTMFTLKIAYSKIEKIVG